MRPRVSSHFVDAEVMMRKYVFLETVGVCLDPRAQKNARLNPQTEIEGPIMASRKVQEYALKMQRDKRKAEVQINRRNTNKVHICTVF